MAKVCIIEVGYVFGENILAIMERAGTDLNRKNISVDDACRRVLESLTTRKVKALKSFYSNIETTCRILRPVILGEDVYQKLMRRTYLADNLEDFTSILSEWRVISTKTVETSPDGVLHQATCESLDVLGKVAEQYSPHWEERRVILDYMVARLQAEIDEYPNLLIRVEETLRGKIGLTDIGYVIVDNKYPNCSARSWGGKTWFVGWSDPPEFVNAETAYGIIADEAAHWIMLEPFTEDKRRYLVDMLREYLSPEISTSELNEAVEGIRLTLMEGFGHLFIGYPWMDEGIQVNLSEPVRRGERGTLYYDSYRFTRWFYDHWRLFLGSDMAATDWGWQCILNNREFVSEIAQRYLEKHSIY